MSALLTPLLFMNEKFGVQSVSIWAMSKMEKMSYLNDQYWC